MKKNIIKIAIAFCSLLVITGILHSWNMLNYPYYESDEGTYIARTWSLMERGELAPYTYWYDHAPLGWVFIAGWIKILGGDFFRFGTSIDTGRVLMLFVHLFSVGIIFYIVRRVTKNTMAAFFAGVLFAVSPLAIYFQRRVLLDNIMMLWVLLSIAVLFAKKVNLRNYIFSGLFFAFAVLTKITAVMFGPPVLLLVFFKKKMIPKVFRTTLWLSFSILTTSIYLLYAMLRNEFFPSKSGEHVSFISSFLFQMSRKGSSVPFWNAESDFFVAVLDWMGKDLMAIYVIFGILVLAVVVSIWSKKLRFFVVASLFYMLFLVRGGVVINFYILPILPFIAMTGAILVSELISSVTKNRKIQNAMFVALLAVIGIHYTFFSSTKHFIKDETSQQRKAISWVKENLQNDSNIIIDIYAYTDIRNPESINEKTFPNADWFYKINRDPAIRYSKYHDNWQNFDYIALTHEMLKQIETDENSLVRTTYRNSLPVAKWLSNGNTFVDEQKYETTNGDWAMIFQVNDKYHAQLLDSWERYREKFIVFQGDNYGQVINPSTNTTTSEGQSYSMLRSAWMNDQKTFDGSWLWTKNHLQHRVGDNLLSWQWKDGKISDSANATDADEDVALALLFGSKLWDNQDYLADAEMIINDLWEHCVVKINGRYYFLPMHEQDADKWSGYLFNPSYLSPATYRIFAEVDPIHDWDKLSDDSYLTLNHLGEMRKNATYLPADWYFLDKKYGGFITADSYFEHKTDDFSFDAFRTLWRVALDDQWFGSTEAKKYLSKTSEFTSQYYLEKGNLPMRLPLSGKVENESNSISVDSGYAISLMYGSDKVLADDFFAKFIDGKYDEKSKLWNEKPSYYGSNWAWFGTGVFRQNLPNMWKLNIFKE